MNLLLCRHRASFPQEDTRPSLSTALRFVEEVRIGDSVVPPERVRFYRLSRPPGDVTDIRGVR